MITVCFVNLVRTKSRLPHPQGMHLLLQRCSGRVRPPSAHNAHDTMLSDANASRSQDLAPSRVRRGTAIFDRTRPHRHFCERGSGSPSSSVRRARKGTSLMSCIHPVEMSSRGGRALVGDPSSGWRCALAWTDHSSRRQRRLPSVPLFVDVALPSTGVAVLHARMASRLVDLGSLLGSSLVLSMCGQRVGRTGGR